MRRGNRCPIQGGKRRLISSGSDATNSEDAIVLSSLVKAVWQYRYFIYTSVRADFNGRVSRSRLGLLWLVIAPLSQVLIYAFVLSSLMSQRLPNIDNRFSYSLYLLAGFLGWYLFTDIFNRCLTLFIDNANVLKKISFPRMALPFVVVISSTINNVIFFVIVAAVYLATGYGFSTSLVWLPVLFLLNILFATGLGLVCGVVNVFIRDVGQMCGVVIQFLFWLTPIVYTINILPPLFQKIVMLNPLFWIIDSYHRVLVYGTAPDYAALGALTLLSVALLSLALFLFRKSSSEMVDVL